MSTNISFSAPPPPLPDSAPPAVSASNPLYPSNYAAIPPPTNSAAVAPNTTQAYQEYYQQYMMQYMYYNNPALLQSYSMMSGAPYYNYNTSGTTNTAVQAQAASQTVSNQKQIAPPVSVPPKQTPVQAEAPKSAIKINLKFQQNSVLSTVASKEPAQMTQSVSAPSVTESPTPRKSRFNMIDSVSNVTNQQNQFKQQQQQQQQQQQDQSVKTETNQNTMDTESSQEKDQTETNEQAQSDIVYDIHKWPASLKNYCAKVYQHYQQITIVSEDQVTKYLQQRITDAFKQKQDLNIGWENEKIPDVIAIKKVAPLSQQQILQQKKQQQLKIQQQKQLEEQINAAKAKASEILAKKIQEKTQLQELVKQRRQEHLSASPLKKRKSRSSSSSSSSSSSRSSSRSRKSTSSNTSDSSSSSSSLNKDFISLSNGKKQKFNKQNSKFNNKNKKEKFGKMKKFISNEINNSMKSLEEKQENLNRQQQQGNRQQQFANKNKLNKRQQRFQNDFLNKKIVIDNSRKQFKSIFDLDMVSLQLQKFMLS